MGQITSQEEQTTEWTERIAAMEEELRKVRQVELLRGSQCRHQLPADVMNTIFSIFQHFKG